MKEIEFFAKMPPEVEKHRGMHIAIIGNKVVASGDSAYAVWKKAKMKHPGKKPVLAFVPKMETLILASEHAVQEVNFEVLNKLDVKLGVAKRHGLSIRQSL